jgi:GAF domain-containing protein
VLEATLQNTLSICVTLTSATHGALFLIDANGRVTRHLLAKADTPAQEARAFVGQAIATGLENWAIQNRQVARAADTRNDFRWENSPTQDASVRSAMAIPLVSREAIVGVVTLMHSSPGHFSDEHERLLTAAADQVAVALDNARIFDTLTRLTDRLSLLYEISQTATQLEFDQALEQAVRAIRSYTGWPTVAAFLLDREGKPVPLASAGQAAQAILDYRLPSGESLVAQAISSAQVERASNGAAVMVAPIRIGSRLLGVLGVHSEQADGFSDQDQELVSSVADTLAMAAAYAEVSRR